MKRKCTRILCMVLSVMMVVSLLPLTVSAACSHNYKKVYTIENEKMHSYKSECSKCGTVTEGWGYAGWEDHSYNSSGECTACGHCKHSKTKTTYSYENSNMHSYVTNCRNCGKQITGGWEDHTFSGNDCTRCDYTKACSHTNSKTTYTDYTSSQHKRASKCKSCGITYNTTTESHDWEYGDWEASSSTKHEREKTCICGRISSESESHDFRNNTCRDCGYTKTTVSASVSLSASGPSGTLGSAGGEISSESYPASYTVTASASGCSVTKITYRYKGQLKTVNGSSVTITANSEDEFTTTTFTAYTSESGVTATFTVNFKYVRKNQNYIMWATSDEATIRSITGNGLNKSLSYTMTIPNSYDTQGNLTSDQVSAIQGLIGRSDGKTYTVNYTRKITVYTPASHSYNGQEIIHGTFDGNSDSEIETCLSTWGWNSSTKSAIRQAAKSSLSFTTGLLTDCMAVWMDTSTNRQLYSKTFGSGTVTPSQSKIVSVSYSEYSGSGNYVYENLAYSGDTSGTSTSQTYSQTYTTSSKPLKVTFYCHPEEVDDTDPPEDDDPIIDDPVVEDPVVTTGEVTIYVRDASTYALLSSAYVSGSGCGGYTNRYGYVSFDGLELGRHTFTASKSGYYSNSGSVRITASDTSPSVTIYLTPIEDEEEEEIIGSIRVYVRDSETNALISGATVSGAGSTKTTNSSGYTTFSSLSLGTYSFTASKTGYESGSGSTTLNSSGTRTLTIYLTPEEVLPTTGDITVYVRDANTNALISGASVSGGGYSGTTNSSGYTKFSSIPLGSYTFTASKSGYSSGSGSAAISTGDTSETITIYLTPLPTSGTITVTVKDADTYTAISGALVSGSGYSGTTNSSGKVTFSSIPFGSYTFTASKTGYSSGSGSASVSVSDTTDSITIYLDKNDADVGITAKNVNGTVYRGSTIIVSAEVTGDSNTDFTPSNPLSVTMSAVMNEDEEFDSQTKSVICPKSETNLVWFIVDIPETGYSDPDVTFTFTVDMPSGYSDSTDSNNESSKTVTTYILPTRTTPDPSFELDAPADFTGSVYKTNNTPELTWSVWEWDGGFTEKEYSAELTVSAKLKPDDTAVWKQYNSSRDQWTTRSGYGLNTEVEVELSDVDDAMYAGNAKVNAYYSEFNYSMAENRSNMLLLADENADDDEYTASFTFDSDTDSISGGKMHKTPIWYPDGEYTVKYAVYDLWTPAGMLTGNTCALIRINGSMYDDYYTNRN